VSPLSGVQWNPGAHPHVPQHSCTQEASWPGTPNAVPDHVQPLCPVQWLFASCIKSWLETLETSTLDVSRIPDSVRELVNKALEEQEQIGWHLATWWYHSWYCSIAISLNPRLKKDIDQNKVWSHKTILQIWEFTHEMWEHHNAILHNHQIESSRQICDAQINNKITKLYENIDSYDVSDRWYFELPLALCLRKPLQNQQWWKDTGAQIIKPSNVGSDDTNNLQWISQCSMMSHESFPWAANPGCLTLYPTTLFWWRPLDPD
jgi:hypothetical protein